LPRLPKSPKLKSKTSSRMTRIGTHQGKVKA
jgi:hypothetical protein